MPAVNSALFRQLLGHFVTGVAIITTRDSDERLVGMTANSIASVSLKPPLLLVCIDHQAASHTAVVGAQEFVVNILSASQEALSRRFAGDYDNRFDGVGYHLSQRGLLVLDGTLAHIECEHYAQHEAGDHTIVIGQVVGGETVEGRPLLYYRGGYSAMK